MAYFIPVVLRNGKWQSDLVHLRSVLRMLRHEAGLSDEGVDPEDAYDRILRVAGRHNLGLETTEPEKD